MSSPFLIKLRFPARSATIIDRVKRIRSKRIAGAYLAAYDQSLGYHYPPDGVIVFEDGSQAESNMVAPHGTGAAGPCFHEPGTASDVSVMVDYFTIPLEQQEAASPPRD
jgi:hypothetical protein